MGLINPPMAERLKQRLRAGEMHGTIDRYVTVRGPCGLVARLTIPEAYELADRLRSILQSYEAQQADKPAKSGSP